MNQQNPFSILIVDDEPNIRSGLTKGLSTEADLVESAGTPSEAIEKFEAGLHPLVILDVRLNSDLTGIDLLKRFVESRPQTAIIVITAHGTVETAVEAMRAGAFDFTLKPVDLNLIRQQVRKARDHYNLRLENELLKHRLADSAEISNMISGGSAMADVFRQIRQVAATDATVMIHGESGTGKELIARAIHDLSDRSSLPFVAANLGALPETLLESELFGHEKGSFSGAIRQKPGYFEQARSGTLFLDEVTEMSPKSQIDLLRVLETRAYSRVGGEEVLHTEARIISATNRSTQDLIEEGKFREDLFYRLNVIPIDVPPLRNRREDIPLLVEHFLEHFSKRHRRGQMRIAPDALLTLTQFAWPGNVRQLRNVVERLVIIAAEETVRIDDLPMEFKKNISVQGPSQDLGTLSEAVEQCERATIMASLEACNHHRENTAKALGISVRTLHYKMSRYGLH